jgi:hypothetical protein
VFRTRSLWSQLPEAKTELTWSELSLARQFRLAETVASFSSVVSLTTCLSLMLFAFVAFASQAIATMMV